MIPLFAHYVKRSKNSTEKHNLTFIVGCCIGDLVQQFFIA